MYKFGGIILCSLRRHYPCQVQRVGAEVAPSQQKAPPIVKILYSDAEIVCVTIRASPNFSHIRRIFVHMQKFSRLIYFVVMVAFVLTLSGGCKNDDDDEGSSQARTDRLMVVTSSALMTGESYKLYRGDKVNVITFPEQEDYNPTYYIAPIDNGEDVVMNLEFADPLSGDLPFMITTEDDDTEKVVFYYNPNGNGRTDSTTEFGQVLRYGGASNQLSYNGLSVAGAALEATGDEVVINLNADEGTAYMNGEAIAAYDYVWHAEPSKRDEYFTLGSSNRELTEDEMKAEISESVYIARDIRYLPDTLEFTGTAKHDEETEYAAYYSDEVAAEVAAELGSGFEGPYIFATLPMSAGQGMPGGDGGTPHDMPSGDRDPTETPVAGAVSNSDIEAFETMTHSAEEAYSNPVLHIHEAGVYRLKGTWHGQIWVDPGDGAQVALILDGITVSCDVAPALVFRSGNECGPTDTDEVSESWRTLGTEIVPADAGAVVILAGGTTNNFTGTNVYRMLKAEQKKDSVTTIDGTDVSQQKKRYKMDAAFYSYVSMAIGTDDEDNPGTLNITSTNYEGLGSEMHLTIDSGTVKVTATDDGINTSEDDVSVFTMDGGSLTVISSKGDGIDSNGWVVINAGSLDITAAQDSSQLNAQGDGPIDATQDVYMSGSGSYTHRAYSGESVNDRPATPDTSTDSGDVSGEDTTDTQTETVRNPIEITNEEGTVVLSIRYTDPSRDTEGSRSLSENGDVFELQHRVNNFAGVRTKEN